MKKIACVSVWLVYILFELGVVAGMAHFGNALNAGPRVRMAVKKAKFCSMNQNYCKLSEKTKRLSADDVRRDSDGGRHAADTLDGENTRKSKRNQQLRRLSRMMREATQMPRTDLKQKRSYYNRHADRNIVDTDTKPNDQFEDEVKQNYQYVMGRKYKGEPDFTSQTNIYNNAKQIDNYSNRKDFQPKKTIYTHRTHRIGKMGNEAALHVAQGNHHREKVLDSIYNLVYENSQAKLNRHKRIK